jgi:hypothetical protein
MAYFAELDSENIVIQVQIVNDDNVVPGDHATNEAWCESNLTHTTDGVSWKQTWKDSSQRGRYAGAGAKYFTEDWMGHSTADKFLGDLPEKYANLFHLDENNFWIPNVPEPIVDDQGRSLPYPEDSIPADRVIWGFFPERNRYQGHRIIDGVDVKKYYDNSTNTWIVWEGEPE